MDTPAKALTGFELVDAVGKKRTRPEAETTTPKSVKKNRQDDVLKAIGDKPVTERHILEQVGDNRYTREILRRLMALEVVQRLGKGGSNDPFLYKFVRTPEEALEMGMVDPTVDIRMQRIENKIIALLADQDVFVTEKQIRACVGDNTGTGKALRRLVKNSRVERLGRGGAGNPFTYQLSQTAIDDKMRICDSIEVEAASPSSPGQADDEDDGEQGNDSCQELSECSTLASSEGSSHADSDSDDTLSVEDYDVASMHADEEGDASPSDNEEDAMMADAVDETIESSVNDASHGPDGCLLELVASIPGAKDSFGAGLGGDAPPPPPPPPPPGHDQSAAASGAAGARAAAARIADDFVTSFLA